MRRATALLCLLLAACNGSHSLVPEQLPEAVVATFVDAIAACSAAVTDVGTIDQRGIATGGWSIAERRVRMNDTTWSVPLPDPPALQLDEYETTEWRHGKGSAMLSLTRWNELTQTRMNDRCRMEARLVSTDNNADVLDGISRHFGRAPDRSGSLPRGGDYLTPRFDEFDERGTGHYWAMPRSDVYLEIAPEAIVRLEIVAMPDRNTLDQYSPDRPESRLVIPTGETE